MHENGQIFRGPQPPSGARPQIRLLLETVFFFNLFLFFFTKGVSPSSEPAVTGTIKVEQKQQ